MLRVVTPAVRSALSSCVKSEQLAFCLNVCSMNLYAGWVGSRGRHSHLVLVRTNHPGGSLGNPGIEEDSVKVSPSTSLDNVSLVASSKNSPWGCSLATVIFA